MLGCADVRAVYVDFVSCEQEVTSEVKNSAKNCSVCARTCVCACAGEEGRSLND